MPDRDIKVFTEVSDQVRLLQRRGLRIDDEAVARSLLDGISYYRLSGYWYPFRDWNPDRTRSERFREGVRLEHVVSLSGFDRALRVRVFDALGRVELAVRAVLGHELGRLHPEAHLRRSLLDPQIDIVRYERWLDRYEVAIADSREDFVVHHRQRYGGRLPVWAAVELLDWGGLSYLYQFAPIARRDAVAQHFGPITSAQFASWLRALNVLRNWCAHHARMWNRAVAISAKLPQHGAVPDLDHLRGTEKRVFHLLGITQYLLRTVSPEGTQILPDLLARFPRVPYLSLRQMGCPDDWQKQRLWSPIPKGTIRG